MRALHSAWVNIRDAGKVLPDEKAELVRPVIPAVTLHLDVFPHQVEPELLGLSQRYIQAFNV